MSEPRTEAGRADHVPLKERGGWRRQRADGYWQLIPCDREGCDKKATVRLFADEHYCGRHAPKGD